MNLKNITKLHKLLSKALGDDLVYSLALDEGKYIIAISVHKSDKWEYSHGRTIQSCLLSDDEMQTDVRDLASKIVPLYKEILVRKATEDV